MGNVGENIKPNLYLGYSLLVKVIYNMKGSVQQCVTSEIDVLSKRALNVFKLVIYIRIGKMPNGDTIMIALISLLYSSNLHGSRIMQHFAKHSGETC